MNDWIDIVDLPNEKAGEKYLMILDGVEQVCHEITETNDNKRWFWGDDNGAYPIDEIEFFKFIEASV